jgi:DNA-binding NarL/FixJ family response regulator
MPDTDKCSIRVVIVDDHPVTLEGIRTILDVADDIEVVGATGEGGGAEALVRDLQPDILLLDLMLPDRRPFEVERWVRRHYPETTTLILTAHDRDALLNRAVTYDVSGYLTKDQDVPHLVASVRRAATGERLLTSRQLRRAHRWQTEVGARLESLTDREREVLKLLGRGMDNAAIATALKISVNTVRVHCRNLYRKLGVSGRGEAAAFARDVETPDVGDPAR